MWDLGPPRWSVAGSRRVWRDFGGDDSMSGRVASELLSMGEKTPRGDLSYPSRYWKHHIVSSWYLISLHYRQAQLYDRRSAIIYYIHHMT
jgi:hypothetical protein